MVEAAGVELRDEFEGYIGDRFGQFWAVRSGVEAVFGVPGRRKEQNSDSENDPENNPATNNSSSEQASIK
jgi:hypothetical protein